MKTKNKILLPFHSETNNETDGVQGLNGFNSFSVAASSPQHWSIQRPRRTGWIRLISWICETHGSFVNVLLNKKFNILSSYMRNVCLFSCSFAQQSQKWGCNLAQTLETTFSWNILLVGKILFLKTLLSLVLVTDIMYSYYYSLQAKLL
jgi:hypothetical protein